MTYEEIKALVDLEQKEPEELKTMIHDLQVLTCCKLGTREIGELVDRTANNISKYRIGMSPTPRVVTIILQLLMDKIRLIKELESYAVNRALGKHNVRQEPAPETT